MRLIEVRCPSCNATVKVQPDSSNVKCTYCRSELYIDDEASQADRFFHTATSAFSRFGDTVSKMRTAKIRVKHDLYYSPEARQEREEEIERSARSTRLLVALLLVLMVGSGIYYVTRPGNWGPIPFSSSEVKGRNYSEVVKQLEDAGFTNVETVPIRDLVTGILTRDGSVEKVTINGDAEFTKNKDCEKSSKITIYFHTFPIKE